MTSALELLAWSFSAMAAWVFPYVFGFLALLMVVSCAPIEPLPGPTSAPVSVREARDDERVPSGKMMTGAVTFRGLDDEGLNQFRVIPEQSSVSFAPRNQRYAEVDGFWWKGDEGRWFKIPDHGEAWVGKQGGEPPFKSDDNEQMGSAEVFWRSNPALRWASSLRGVGEPGFYPNAGRTRIGTPYPF